MSRTEKKPPKKTVVRLAVIPEPEPGTRAIFHVAEGTVVFQDTDNVQMVCGNCGAVIVDGMKASRILNLVFECNGCGTFNETLS